MMKKITLLFILLAVSFGYSQTLPFNFSDPAQQFTDAGGSASLETDPGDSDEPADPTNDVMRLDTGAGAWDNVVFTFATRVDLSVSATNSISFRMKATTDLGERTHLMKWEDNVGGTAVTEISFTTAAGTEWQEFSLDFDDHDVNNDPGTYAKLFIFTDAGAAGLSGTYLIDDISAPEAAPETCSDGIQNQDETGVDCGGVCAPCDVTAPTGFTATVGTVGAFSIELLLTATDETSANITYDITGDVTAQTTGASGVETSYIISGLTPQTLYSFDVSASDASGNPAANNAITVASTTIADTSTSCAGFSSEASEGVFSVGYNYSFVTSGTDVLITFELLDTDKTGYVPQVFIAPSTFLNMDGSGAPTYTYTLTGQVDGTMPNFAIRGAYAGGLVTSQFFDYTVGDACVLGTDDFDLASFSVYPNPTQDSWNLKSKSENISSIRVFDILGKSVISLSPNSSEATIDGSSLKSGLYFAQVKTANGVSRLKLVKQ